MTGESPEQANRSTAEEEANLALKDAEWAEGAGLPERAVTAYRRVVALFPAVWEAHNNLANLLLDLGRPAEALESAQAARALRPDDPLVNANMGRALLRLDRPGEAIPHLRMALQASPGAHELRDMLARAFLDAGQLDEGAAVFAEVEELAANDFPLLQLMSRFYHRIKRGADAERCLLQMRHINPRHAPVYADLAHLYIDFGEYSRAIEVARDGLKLDPDSATFLNLLAISQTSHGLVDDALQSYRRVIELAPNNALAHSNLLLTMHYVSELDPAEIYAEHQRFGRVHTPPALATRSFPNAPEPGRRLRIGYLSPDIRRHSVAFFLEPLLDYRDRERFEVYAYAAVKTVDEVTTRLRGKFDQYRSVFDMPNPVLAQLMKADQIDILIDLAGHAGSPHAPTLGYKPAPVLVTYLGYPDTTGIETVDYRISDWISDPPGAEASNTEQLVRLPDGFLCFRPPGDLPAVGAPPSTTKGYVTFGSYNREFKVSRKALDLWCRILLAVPGSRLIMKSVASGDPATRERQLGDFEQRGVDRNRVQLVGFVPEQKDHLAAYREIDIALDTYPYHGTTTTLDSLLMGVPVVSLSGYNHASRVGASLLSQAGLQEFIAYSEDEYVAKAVALAGNPAQLAALHGKLSERFLASSLCDGPGFVRKFEFALCGMWLNWCRAQGVELSAAEAAQAAFDFSAA
ncbi:MAG: tetratricopeptide repeat protein, partial [Chromatiales bacterium]|nr:tetratricopeptide repeat protein [Chromatiales bacterium]